MSFVHLHAHSVYSLLDGHSRIPAMVERAAELGMPALALTDHGVLYGALDFYLEARRAGIKPIIGCEFYVAPRSMRDREFSIDKDPPHLTVLARDGEGYQNLLKLVTAAHLEGMYYRPRVDKDLLARHAGGLIALSGCLGAEIPRALVDGDLAHARQATSDFIEIFGRENFYLELQDQGIEIERVSNAGLTQLSREFGLPLVATNDIHYVRRDDSASHDVLLCIQTKARVSDQNRMRFETDQFYLKSAEEMRALFPDHPEAIGNTLEIAARCNVEIPLGESKLPRFDVPDGLDPDTYLRRLAEAGVARRYPQLTDQVRERLEGELSLIRDMGFATYFLIVWDFVRHAREGGIPVGPGRGSVTGSIVAYALGITALDPLQYGLIFERFLNRERISMPDIDIDFSKLGREQMIRYVTEKYGTDRVAQIVTFQRQMSRQAIRDVARVLEVPVEDAMRLTNEVRQTQGRPHSIEQELRENPAFRELAAATEQMGRVVEIARGLEGVARNAGVHAAGVVIAPEPLVEFAPLTRVPRSVEAEGAVQVMTQYDMKGVQMIGLLKMDFLGLRNLDIMVDCLRHIRDTTGREIVLDEIPQDDQRTFELMSRGDTLGTFQFEGKGFRDLLQQMRPSRFEDVIVAGALFRPGAMEHIDEYCRRKHGLEDITYITPLLEPVLRDTYGVIVYQEQVMQIAERVAGFTMGEADVLRAAMGKKDQAKMAAMRQKFLAGAMSNGVESDLAEALYQAIEKFSGYGFNKSHAAAYALISYWTSYLKANHPLEYMAALLTHHMGDTGRIGAIIADTRARGIEVQPPDIQHSRRDFVVADGRIVFGLRGIKNVGDRAIDALVTERERGGPFESLLDLCRRVGAQELGRRAVESLIKCGACDSLGERAQLLASLEAVMDAAQREQRDRESGQVGLFEMLTEEPEWDQVPLAAGVVPATAEERLKWERELVGLYISDHPLRRVEDQLRVLSDTMVAEIDPEMEGQVVRLGGMVQSVRTRITRRQELMAYVELEDLTGSIEIVLFPRTYDVARSRLQPDAIVVIEGVVEARAVGRAQEDDDTAALERVSVRGENVWAHDDDEARAGWERRQVLHLDLPGEASPEALSGIRGILEQYPGDAPVRMHIDVGEHEVSVATEALTVAISTDLEAALEHLFGRRVTRVETIRRRAEAGSRGVRPARVAAAR